MNELPFEKFIALVTFDKTIKDIENEIQITDQKLLHLNNSINQLQIELEGSKSSVASLKKQVDAQELEMQMLETQQKEKQQALDRISNHKEYQSLSHEIESLKKNQYDKEEALIAIWNSYETAQRSYDQKAASSNAQLELLESDKKAFEQQKAQMFLTFNELESQRVSKLNGIPQEWLDKYAMMRKNVSNPVVPITNGSCSACFYMIPNKDLGRLNKNALLQCQDCYRFLFRQAA